MESVLYRKETDVKETHIRKLSVRDIKETPIKEPSIRDIKDEEMNRGVKEFCEEYKEILQRTKISIVIPMYNEAKSIGNVIMKIPKFPNYEIIVVDDGSKDKSVATVKRFHHVTILRHTKNQGYGKTILDGIFHATGDIVISLDSDGQHDPRDLPALIKPIIQGKSQVTVGSRYLGEFYYNLPFTTRAGEAFLEIMMFFLFGRKIKSNQGGFRAFKKETVPQIFSNLRFLDFTFATEVLIKASLHKFKIKEVPIHLHDREYGTSRINLIILLKTLVKCLMHYVVVKILGKRITRKIEWMLNRALHYL